MKKNKFTVRHIMNIMRSYRFTLIELLVSTYCLYPRKLV